MIRIWWRAFSIVTLTALNVTQVAGHHYLTAFFTGGMLSWVWWGNAKAASVSDNKWNALTYAFGAACGTVTGMLLGRVV